METRSLLVITRRLILVVTLLLTLAVTPGTGHGRLMDPPARNSMWRLGFPNPVNYNDNELYCGGRVTQWARNKGRCGVCGDPHHASREHETGGKYANGIIGREYEQGEVVDVTVHITANHKGYFEFRICPVTDPKVEVTQECLNQHVMDMTNEEGKRFYLPEGKSNQFFNISLQLPPEMTCQRCVIQWKYRTGNTWDKDETGRFCVGCGPQEEFYNCADVTIYPRDPSSGPAQTRSKSHSSADVVKRPQSTTDELRPGYKTDIVFTDRPSQLKVDISQLNGKRKQKLHPAQGLDEGKVSVWSKGAAKDNVGNVGLVDIAGPTGVAYRWTAAHSNRHDLQKLRQRFGYASVLDQLKQQGTDLLALRPWGRSGLARRTKLAGKTSGLQPNSTQKQGQSLRQTFFRATHTSAENPANVLSPSKPQAAKHKTRTQPDSQSAKHSTKQKPGSQTAKHSPILQSGRQADRQSRKDNFLRRWKLSRLRQIAAMRAENSTGTSNLHRKGQRVSSPASGLSGSAISVPLQLSADRQHHTQVIHPGTSSTSAHGHSENGKTRRKFLKTKLPSWLIKALRLQTDHETDEEEEGTDDYHRQNGHAMTDRRTATGKTEFRTQPVTMANDEHEMGSRSKHRSAVAQVGKDVHTARHVSARTGYPGHLSTRAMTAPGSTSELGGHSDRGWKAAAQGNEQKTESLVRFIVSLLLSDKSDQSGGQRSADSSGGQGRLAWLRGNQGNVSQLASYPGAWTTHRTASRAQTQPFSNLILTPHLAPAGRSQHRWSHEDVAVDPSTNFRSHFSPESQVFGDSLRQVAAGQPQTWGHSHLNGVADLNQDSHAVWQARAMQRREHYTRQGQTGFSALSCQSVARSGPGMDAWCTNNCNANFCPPSVCLCTARSPTRPFPAIYTPGRNSYSWTPEAQTGDFQQQSDHEGDHWSDLGGHELRQLLLYRQGDRFLSPTHSPGASLYHSSSGQLSRRTGYQGRDLMPTSPRGVHAETFMRRDIRAGDNTLSAHDTSYHPENRGGGIPVDAQESPSSYGNHILPQSFRATPSQPPRDLRWLTTPSSYHDNTINSLSPHTDLASYVDYASYGPEKLIGTQRPRLLPTQTLDHAWDGNYLGHNQLYMQDYGSAPSRPHLVDSERRLSCQAIGAYSGLEHFDEWCQTTCSSTVCPLLICSCH